MSWSAWTAAWRNAGENALSCRTSCHGGKYGSRPHAKTAPSASKKSSRRARQILDGPPDEVLGMRRHPGVIRRNVVGHEIQHQPQPAHGELLPRRRQAVWAAEVRIHCVTADAVGRPHVVRRREVGQGPPEIDLQSRVGPGDAKADRAAFPHAHQPDGVRLKSTERIPCLRGHAPQGDRPAEPLAELVKPYPGVDLVDDGTLWPAHGGRLLLPSRSPLERQSSPAIRALQEQPPLLDPKSARRLQRIQEYGFLQGVCEHRAAVTPAAPVRLSLRAGGGQADSSFR